MSRSRSLARSAVLLGMAMALANVLGYVFTVLVSRSLGPADFGALSALFGLGIVGAVPAGALQISVARRRARAADGAAGTIFIAVRMGVALFLASLATIPAAVPLLHLHSGWSIIWLGLSLVPMTMTGAYQGVLLGAERMRALSALYVVNGTSRLAAGVVAVLLGVGVAGVVAAVAIAAWITCFVGFMLVGPIPSAARRVRLSISKEIVHSSGALVGLLLLSNIDLLLARHFLNPQVSGYYALAGMFGKVVLWGTQFLALAVLPRSARGRTHSLPLLASAAVAIVGGVATGAIWVLAGPLVGLTGGEEYSAAAAYAVPFALLGTLWALTQVLLFNDLARQGSHLGIVVWMAVTIEVLVIVFALHDSPGQLLTGATLSAGLVAGVGLFVARRRRRSERNDRSPDANLVIDRTEVSSTSVA